MLGDQERGFGQAAGADRDSGNFAERFAANAAVIGEEEVEKTAQALPCGIGDAAGGQTGEQTTGEVPPPTNIFSLQQECSSRTAMREHAGRDGRKGNF